jgi:hypothetical protein
MTSRAIQLGVAHNNHAAEESPPFQTQNLLLCRRCQREGAAFKRCRTRSGGGSNSTEPKFSSVLKFSILFPAGFSELYFVTEKGSITTSGV